MVAGILQHSYLILHLNHQHGMVRVHLVDVAYQLPERAVVGLQHVGRERGGYLQRFALGSHRTRKPLGVGLEPCRSVAAHGILPGSEPQEYKFEVVAARFLYRDINEREIEFALLRLGQVPVHGRKHRVEVHPFQLREYGAYILR